MNCKTCDKVLSGDAIKCPGCGEYTARGRTAIVIAFVLLLPFAIIVGVVVFAIISTVLGV